MVPDTRVLVTGVAGFLGSSLLPALLARGYEVVGLDDLSHGARERVAEHEGSRFRFVEGDVCDADCVRSAAAGVGSIIHFAELKIPRYGGALEMLETNVRGAETVLEIAAEKGARVLLGSTDDVYGKNAEAPLSEESALVLGQSDVSRWGYAVSKVLAEHLCFAYQEKHGLRSTIVRFVHAYGPGQPTDWHGGPQSVFITAALRGEALPIHGDGLQTRTFAAVSDLVSGTLLALESRYADGEILNIGSTDSVSIVNLAYLIWRLVGHDEKPRLEFVPYTDFPGHYEDARHRAVDISKARYLLGYEPRVPLIEGLKQTIAWQVERDRGGH